MARELTEYRVFFASPGGLQNERRTFRRVIDEYNALESRHRGVLFIAVGWEDTLPGVGRPQSLINAEIEAADYFVLMFWDRWGTPPASDGESLYTSGTEEEFHVAKKCHREQDRPLKQLAVFFKGISPAQLNDPGPQVQRVLQFRREIEASHELLYQSFDRGKEFEHKLRGLLAQWRRDHEDGTAMQGGPSTPQRPMMPPPSTDISMPGYSSPNRDLLISAWRSAEDGKLTEAETLFARSIARGDDPEAFRSFGAFLLRVGRNAQAGVMFDRIIEMTAEGDKRWQAVGYGNLGLIAEMAGDYEDAMHLHRKSLAIHEQLNQVEGQAQVQNNLGVLEKRQGNLAGAEHLYRLALENARSAQRPDLVGKAYNNLGLLFRDRHEFAQAERMHLDALELAEQRGDQQGIATACANLGSLNHDWNRLEIAGEMFLRTLSLSHKLNLSEAVALANAGKAAILIRQGSLDQAEPLLRESLRISTDLGRNEGIASATLNLGVLAIHRGQLDSAGTLVRAALDIYSDIGDPLWQANAEELSGEIARISGDRISAQQFWISALGRFESLGLGNRAELLQRRLEQLKNP